MCLLAGKSFTVTERMRTNAAARKDSVDHVDTVTNTTKKDSDTDSNCSDSYVGKSRVMTLQADSPQVCSYIFV